MSAVIEGRNLMVPIIFYTEEKMRRALERSLTETVEHETGLKPTNARWEFLMWHDFEEDNPLEGEYNFCDKADAEVARLTVEVHRIDD